MVDRYNQRSGTKGCQKNNQLPHIHHTIFRKIRLTYDTTLCYGEALPESG